MGKALTSGPNSKATEFTDTEPFDVAMAVEGGAALWEIVDGRNNAQFLVYRPHMTGRSHHGAADRTYTVHGRLQLALSLSTTGY